MEQRLETALELIRSGDCRQAVPVLRHLLSAPPDTARGREVRLFLARCLTRLEDYSAASGFWEEVAAGEDRLQKAEAEFYLGWIAERLGKRKAARERMELYLQFYPGSTWEGEALLTLARIKKDSGDLDGARGDYRKALEILPSGDDLLRARKELGELNLSLLLSPVLDEENRTYTVRAGDSLSAIARAYNTTPALLRKMNGIPGEIIRPGQVLKVPGFRFEAIISKSWNTLTLLYGGSFFKEYSVGTGRDNCSPTGEFVIVTKLINPPWIHGGEVIPPFDSRNILGSRWMGFSDPYADFGIHGTIEPETIGSQSSDGCVRMLNRDVEELFMFLPRGTGVVIEE